MGTSLAIDTGIRQPQPLYRTAPDDMLLNNLPNVARMNIAIPDGFRINHDDRTVLALIQAGGLIGTDPVLESGLFQGILER
jgi:hypothetical protein